MLSSELIISDLFMNSERKKFAGKKNGGGGLEHYKVLIPLYSI